jgi:hypothetical protein
MSVNSLLWMTLALGLVLVLALIVLAWLVFGMSYTLTQLLILLKDQHDTRCFDAAKAIAIRTKRHKVTTTILESTVYALKSLRDIASRIEANTAGPVDQHERKTVEMALPLLASPDEDAVALPATVRAKNDHSAVLLPEPPPEPPPPAPPPPAPREATRDSEAETQFWPNPPSEGALVGASAVPAK